jgi:hypothetical protein
LLLAVGVEVALTIPIVAVAVVLVLAVIKQAQPLCFKVKYILLLLALVVLEV